jgi:GH15 family glucan-1,4-alpha-glucosidase
MTNVLETTFTTASGQVRVTDFMPVRRRRAKHKGHDVDTDQQILRLVEAVSGPADVDISFRPTFDYARAETTISTPSEGGAVATGNGQYLALACPGTPLSADGQGGVAGRLALGAGERRWLALTLVDSADAARAALTLPDADAALTRTVRYWDGWAADGTYHGPYRNQVLRSALVLKLLTYEPTGAVVAAPTTSLPEEIGGERNWDYRFTWLRDSSLILSALMTLGHQEESVDFGRWLRRTVESDPKAELQIMYTIDGGRDLPEITIDGLTGYRDSRPVRVGNGAAGQRQLDIFGEVMIAIAVHFLVASRRPGQPRRARGPSRASWALVQRLVGAAAAHWQEPDSGIWEVRGGPQQFLYSRLMCWAAMEAGVRLASAFKLQAPLAQWTQTRDAIRTAILERGYNDSLGAFTQAFGNTALDASALAIPRLGFLPATDPRVQSTVDRIQRDLTHNGLVYRYRTEDGLAGGEATFALCTFWLIDALALGGRLDEAQALFERTIGYANDVGLLAEEIDPTSGALIGNFPQGFTHLGLIRSAVILATVAQQGPEHTAQTDVDRVTRVMATVIPGA